MNELSSPPAVAAWLTLCEECRLQDEHFEALSRQGFVGFERGRKGKYLWKLRFRHEGRQVVRYLGIDPGRTKLVRDALAVIQAPERQM
jgi:hypothetical protein